MLELNPTKSILLLGHTKPLSSITLICWFDRYTLPRLFTLHMPLFATGHQWIRCGGLHIATPGRGVRLINKRTKNIRKLWRNCKQRLLEEKRSDLASFRGRRRRGRGWTLVLRRRRRAAPRFHHALSPCRVSTSPLGFQFNFLNLINFVRFDLVGVGEEGEWEREEGGGERKEGRKKGRC